MKLVIKNMPDSVIRNYPWKLYAVFDHTPKKGYLVCWGFSYATIKGHKPEFALLSAAQMKDRVEWLKTLAYNDSIAASNIFEVDL